MRSQMNRSMLPSKHYLGKSESPRTKCVRYLLWILLVLVSSSIVVMTAYKYLKFEQQVSGRLKRVADADTIPLARMELESTLRTIEKLGLTEGYSNIFFYTPDCDIKFWYRNLEESSKNLASLPENSDHLTKSNQLMRLRDTILDGNKVTQPPFIALSPNQKIWFFSWIISICGFIFAFFLLTG